MFLSVWGSVRFWAQQLVSEPIELNRGLGPKRERGRGVTEADVAEVTGRDAVIAIVNFFSDDFFL